MSPLVALPRQPAAVPWPGTTWPEGALAPEVDVARLAAALEAGFDESAPEIAGETHAFVAVHRGAIVAERYARGYGRDSVLPSWSMAKSVLHAAVGVLVRQGRLDVKQPAPVAAWAEPGDPRGKITLDHLLRMSSGLRFDGAQTVPEELPTIQMLFGAGKDDVAAYAASFPPDHPPDTVCSYSSGTSNIVSAIAGAAVGGGEPEMRRFLERELFGPIGMRSAEPRFDAAGTWVASSFLSATARDFARFGLLYLRDGVWNDRRLLPEGWVDYARTPTPTGQGDFGAHFWLAQDGSGTFSANGFLGQYTVMVPARDLVLVRLGSSRADQKRAVVLFLSEVVQSFPLA
jgi:CubicO group peptidase (beta-lactamase class C family)